MEKQCINVDLNRLHLGQVCRKPIKTAAATIILAQRKKGDFLPNDQIKKLEAIGGEACLRTLTKVKLDESVRPNLVVLNNNSICANYITLIAND